jgi:hypothetical protein
MKRLPVTGGSDAGIHEAAPFRAMTVDDVAHLDLRYSPPLGRPWDPGQTACMEWARATHPSDPGKDA